MIYNIHDNYHDQTLNWTLRESDGHIKEKTKSHAYNSPSPSARSRSITIETTCPIRYQYSLYLRQYGVGEREKEQIL